MSFNELGLSPHILRAVKELGYEQPTPIQQQAIPAILAGQDVLGGAQTGTGKTAGFTLPMLHRLLANHGRGGRRQVRALVLAGVESPPKNLQYTRTVKGGKAATAATVGLGALQAVQDGLAPARDALQTLVPYLGVARWLLLTITLIGIGVMIWARVDDYRKGLR